VWRCGLEAGVARSRYTSTCFGAEGWATDSEPGEVSCSPTPARGADGRGPAVTLAWRDGRSAQLHCGVGMGAGVARSRHTSTCLGAEGWATDREPGEASRSLTPSGADGWVPAPWWRGPGGTAGAPTSSPSPFIPRHGPLAARRGKGGQCTGYALHTRKGMCRPERRAWCGDSCGARGRAEHEVV